jgi:hypothetical protein
MARRLRSLTSLNTQADGSNQGTMIAIPAERYHFEFDPAHIALLIIAMQRDLLAPGGFGGMLSNDVLQLRRTREPARRSLAAWRRAGSPMAMHTRERPRPDLADLPRAKRIRGRSATHAILHKRNITELVVTGGRRKSVSTLRCAKRMTVAATASCQKIAPVRTSPNSGMPD